jgi:small redox-active disulfide protein 2
MIRVEVFGPGCQRCQATLAAVEQAVAATGLQVSLVHVSDPVEMAHQRAVFTPVVRVNGETKSTGRVPKPAEIAAWLAAAKAAS